MKDDFVELHLELNKDVDTLWFHIERVADKIKLEDQKLDDLKAYQSAIMLLCYSYMNKKDMSKNELLETYSLIVAKVSNKIN